MSAFLCDVIPESVFKTRSTGKSAKEGKIGNMKRHEISETQWNRIRKLPPPERKPRGGRPAKDNRLMLTGIIYWLNTGILRRDLPERFGPWKSVCTRFRTWTLQGVWERVFAALTEEDIVDESTLMPDSTTIKVHQHGASKKGRRIKHQGSRCGRWVWKSLAVYSVRRQSK